MKHNVSAHPIVDLNTGEFFALGYSIAKPVVHYSRFDKDRKLLNTVDIKITSVRMLHDFIVTDDYVIIPDLPLEGNP